MDPKKDKVLPTPAPAAPTQPIGVLREREVSPSIEKPLDDEATKYVQVNPNPADEPPVSFPAQTVKIEISEPKVQGSSMSISKAEAQKIIKTSAPDDSKRGKAVIIVRESDIRELRSKNAF